MAMEGLTECAAGCGAPISGATKLCERRRAPGGVVRVSNSTMIFASWYAENAGEAGITFSNDYALGDLFGGRRVGFEAKQQRFTAVVSAATPTVTDEITNHANKTVVEGAPPFVDDMEAE